MTNADDGVVDANGEPIMRGRDQVAMESAIPMLPLFPAAGAIAAVDGLHDELEIVFAGVQGDRLGEARLKRQPEFQELGGARVPQGERLGAQRDRRGLHDGSVTYSSDDLAGVVKFGKSRAHDASRGAELFGQLALRGDAFARLDASLIDALLDCQLHPGHLLAGPGAHVPGLRQRWNPHPFLAGHLVLTG